MSTFFGAIDSGMHWVAQDILRLAVLSMIVGWFETVLCFSSVSSKIRTNYWSPRDYLSLFLYFQLEVAIGLTAGFTLAYLAIDERIPPALQQVYDAAQTGIAGITERITNPQATLRLD